MIDTYLFDLDGTLLQFSQDAFIGAYFAELSKVFVSMNLDPDLSVKAVWAGTKAMIKNDGTVPNLTRFWDMFGEQMHIEGSRLRAVEHACDSFYSNEFDSVKRILRLTCISRDMIHALKDKGYKLVLASNPLFPECAYETRLRWAGLSLSDFCLVTHYSNSTFCKPNPEYYREIFRKIGKSPEQCFMSGNNPAEDMCAAALGAEVFLVTDFLENESGADISAYRHGTLLELSDLLLSAQSLR